MGVQSIVASRLVPSNASQPAPSPRPSQQEQVANPALRPVADRLDVAFQKPQPEKQPDILETRAKNESALLQDPSKTRAGTRLEIDDRTERVIAQILNQDREVIKQIPPEEKINLLVRIRETQGLLFDELA